jgi:hypothetical protein
MKCTGLVVIRQYSCKKGYVGQKVAAGMVMGQNVKALNV